MLVVVAKTAEAFCLLQFALTLVLPNRLNHPNKPSRTENNYFYLLMPFFFLLSGSPTKFSKTGFLLQAIESILKKRNVELRTAHKVDFDREQFAPGTPNGFITKTCNEITRAMAVVLVSSVVKESSTRLLASLLDVLGDNVFARKPVVLIATGGFPAQVLTVEHMLKPTLLRLGTPTVAARVHLGAGYWRIVADGQLRLSHEGEQEITDALDLVLRGVVLRRGKRAPVFGLTRTAASNSAATRAAIP